MASPSWCQNWTGAISLVSFQLMRWSCSWESVWWWLIYRGVLVCRVLGVPWLLQICCALSLRCIPAIDVQLQPELLDILEFCLAVCVLDDFLHMGMNICPICEDSLSHHTFCMGNLVWFHVTAYIKLGLCITLAKEKRRKKETFFGLKTCSLAQLFYFCLSIHEKG